MRITHLWRYPVKSLGGEPLTSTRVDRGGIPFDRQYIILDGDTKRKGKTLDANLVAELLAYTASADNGSVSVRTPDALTFAVNEAFSSHLQSALQRPLSIESAKSASEPFHDEHDILVINAASIRALSEEWGSPVNPLRFRPNIMIDGDDVPPYGENEWVGRTFQVGDALFEGAMLDARCAVTTIDPETLQKRPDFLRLIVERHNMCFGLYCRVRAPGRIEVGDEWQPQ